LVENIDVDSLLLTKGNLSKPFKKMINDGLITKDEALQIQSQLIDEYENKQVLPEGIVR
jgi:polyhydroxyalkanoate synthesis regulator phasin